MITVINALLPWNLLFKNNYFYLTTICVPLNSLNKRRFGNLEVWHILYVYGYRKRVWTKSLTSEIKITIRSINMYNLFWGQQCMTVEYSNYKMLKKMDSSYYILYFSDIKTVNNIYCCQETRSFEQITYYIYSIICKKLMRVMNWWLGSCGHF